MKRNNWEIVKLKEIAEIIMGQSPKSEFYNTDREGLPFFQGCSEFGALRPVPKKWCTKPLKIAYKDDVLMSVRAPVGDLNIADRKCIIGRGLCAIRTKLNSGRFLYYLLKGNIMEIISLGTGSVYDAINKSAIENLEIEIPPLETQCKIAAILSAYDDLIENNTRRIQILEEMAQTIYKEWFVKFCFPGYEKVKMVDSELGKIPEGWEVKKVKGIVKRLKAGRTYTQKEVLPMGNIPVVDQSRSEFLGFHNNESDHYASSEEPIIIFGDHTCKMQIMVGPFSLGPNVIPFISNDSGLIYYLFFLVRNLVETHEYKRHWNDLVIKKVALAGKKSQFLFSEMIKPLTEEINLLMKRNLNLRRTRDLLLPKLISGEIDVEV